MLGEDISLVYFNFHVKVVHLLANIGYQAMQIFPSKKIISMWHFSAVGTFTGLTNDFGMFSPREILI